MSIVHLTYTIAIQLKQVSLKYTPIFLPNNNLIGWLLTKILYQSVKAQVSLLVIQCTS